MEVFFKPIFIKDFQKLPIGIRSEVRRICTGAFTEPKKLFDLDGVQIKAIQGFNGYYRIRFGDDCIGFKKEKEKIIFMRVLHRKDIYRFFP